MMKKSGITNILFGKNVAENSLYEKERKINANKQRLK